MPDHTSPAFTVTGPPAAPTAPIIVAVLSRFKNVIAEHAYPTTEYEKRISTTMYTAAKKSGFLHQCVLSDGTTDFFYADEIMIGATA